MAWSGGGWFSWKKKISILWMHQRESESHKKGRDIIGSFCRRSISFFWLLVLWLLHARLYFIDQKFRSASSSVLLGSKERRWMQYKLMPYLAMWPLFNKLQLRYSSFLLFFILKQTRKMRKNGVLTLADGVCNLFIYIFVCYVMRK